MDNDVITIEECISRLDAIRHEIVSDSRDHFALSAGIAALYELEGGRTVNPWIPCKDAMPESKEPVIFTVDRGRPFVCVGYRINSEKEGLKLQRWFDKLSGLNFSDYDVKAWMPIPDAYDPESEAHDYD